MSLLEKIKVFVSNEDLLSEFIDTINKILKIEAWVKGCKLKKFLWAFKQLVQNWHFSQWKKNFLDIVSRMVRFSSLYVKISYKIL